MSRKARRNKRTTLVRCQAGATLSLRKGLCRLHASLCPKGNKRYWVVTCLSTVCQSWRLRQRARRSLFSFFCCHPCVIHMSSRVTRYLFMIVRLPSNHVGVGVLASHQHFISEKENLIALSGVVSFAQKSWRGPFLVCLVDDARLAT